MITKESVYNLITDRIAEDDCFIVEIKVSASNKIMVLIDSVNGITIDYCIQISKLIDGTYDREVEDFELEVSTPGLGQPLRVLQQYQKNVGREVEVILFEGVPFKGVLVGFTDNDFTVEEEKKVKIEGKKKKELKTFSHTYKFDEVKSVKVIISF